MTTSAQDKLPLPVELPSVVPDQDFTSAQVGGLAFTQLYDEPLLKLSQDLYILPDVLEVFLEAFERPLDLLLYLIRCQNLNVLDIPLAQVIRQYLAYIEQIHTINLELTAEYLLMAAMFVEIRSCMLLPARETDSDDGPEDPRAELVRRLLEYEQTKPAAQKFDTVPQLDHNFLRAQVYIEQSLASRYPGVNSDDLCVVRTDVLHCAKLTQHHKISREELLMREHMSQILHHLQHARFMGFIELFEEAIQSGKGIPIVVVSFVTTLGLSRESLLEITQAEPYAPIYARLAYSPM